VDVVARVSTVEGGVALALDATLDDALSALASEWYSVEDGATRIHGGTRLEELLDSDYVLVAAEQESFAEDNVTECEVSTVTIPNEAAAIVMPTEPCSSRPVYLIGGKRKKQLPLQKLLDACAQEDMVALCSTRLVEASDFGMEFKQVPVCDTRLVTVKTFAEEVSFRVGVGAKWGDVARLVEVRTEEAVSLFDGPLWMDFAAEVDRDRVMARTRVDVVARVSTAEGGVALAVDATVDEVLSALGFTNHAFVVGREKVNGGSRVVELAGHRCRIVLSLSDDWDVDCSCWNVLRTESGAGSMSVLTVGVHIKVDGDEIGLAPHCARVAELVERFHARLPEVFVLEGYGRVLVPHEVVLGDLLEPIIGDSEGRQLVLELRSVNQDGIFASVLMKLESDNSDEWLLVRVRESSTFEDLQSWASEKMYCVAEHCFVDSENDVEKDGDLEIAVAKDPPHLIFAPSEEASECVCWLRCSNQASPNLERTCCFQLGCSADDWKRVVQHRARLVMLDRFDSFVVDGQSYCGLEDALDRFFTQGSALECKAWSGTTWWAIHISKGAQSGADWTVV